MGCNLITIEDVEAYAGVTYDSAETIVMEAIIAAVSDWTNCYLNTNLCDDLTIQRVEVIDNIITLKNHPRTIYGAFSGIESVIEVSNSSALTSINIITGTDGSSAAVANQKICRLITGFTETDIDITELSLSSVATAINAEAGWTATYVGDNNVYGANLFSGNFQLDTSSELKLYASSNNMDIAQTSDKIYSTGTNCTTGHVIYQSGYETLPSDLTDALVRITLQAYKDRNPATGVSGDLKRERIGDYEYEVLSASELTTSIGSLSIDYKAVLDCYKTVDI
jgi:hypothetical protein